MAIRRDDRRRDAGDVYPVPSPLCEGVFDVGGAGAADAGVVGLRSSLTHLGVRSLACSPPPSPRPPAAPILSSGAIADAGHRDRRAPVGGRGQGQDDRLPRRAGRDGRSLPGRRQRRAHGRQRRRGVQAAASRHRACCTRTSRRSSATGSSSTRVTLIDELDMLTSRGIDVSRVRVSRSAHVIMPYHVALDRANEARSGGAKVGTTGRGIGPTYGDRAWRLGLRMEDLLDPDILRERIGRALPDKNLLLTAPGQRRRSRSSRSWPKPPPGASGSATTSTTRPGSCSRALARGEHVLLEGAQGTLLDLDHGSYPFVTSSNPVAGGACTGGGIGPLQVDEVIGVMKAYSTRVGSGPYPDRAARRHRGRHRRARATNSAPSPAGRGASAGSTPCPLRYAVAVNSVSSIMLNKLDILSGIPTAPAVRRVRGRRAARRRLAVQRRRARAGGADLRVVRRLERTDPRRPIARRPARERAPLPERHRGRTPACRSCSCRSGRSGPRRSSGPGARCAAAPGIVA